ncbi:hypothetical protein ACFWBC_02045 [Streptomyces sp. NPDC059985]|uniref:hypothetical protein n=1 Tax=Streptomyces sp. NPDC059985 TaxID=3347025 RepID=UPI0036A31E4B
MAVLGLVGSVVAGATTATGGGAGGPAHVDGRDALPPTAGTPREATAQEEDLLHTAEQLLLRDCMREAGFVYEPVPRQPVPEAKEFLYVVDDLDWAGRHGYGSDIERKHEQLRAEDVNQRYFQSLPQQRRAAAIGAANGPRPEGMTARTPDGLTITRSSEGCRSQAQRTLYPQLETWFRARVTMDSLPSLRGAKVLADGAFLDAARNWSTCMRAAGHDFKDPAAVRASLPPPERPLPRDQEVALAVAEAGCARTSGLAATAARLDRTYDAELRAQYRSDVETWLGLRTAALPRARSVIEADRGAATPRS